MISWFKAEDFSGGIREDRLKPMKGDDKNLYYNLDHPGQYCPIVMESSDISFPVFGHVVIDPGKKRCSPVFEASANSQRQDYHHVQSCIGVLSQL